MREPTGRQRPCGLRRSAFLILPRLGPYCLEGLRDCKNRNEPGQPCGGATGDGPLYYYGRARVGSDILIMEPRALALEALPDEYRRPRSQARLSRARPLEASARLRRPADLKGALGARHRHTTGEDPREACGPPSTPLVGRARYD